MSAEQGILGHIRAVATKKRLFLPHALRQMTRLDRMITTAEVRAVIEIGEVVEDYPEDPRGHSCLLLGYGEGGRPLHVLCSPKEDYLAIITSYIPTEKEWSENFKVRMKS